MSCACFRLLLFVQQTVHITPFLVASLCHRLQPRITLASPTHTARLNMCVILWKFSHLNKGEFLKSIDWSSFTLQTRKLYCFTLQLVSIYNSTEELWQMILLTVYRRYFTGTLSQLVNKNILEGGRGAKSVTGIINFNLGRFKLEREGKSVWRQVFNFFLCLRHPNNCLEKFIYSLFTPLKVCSKTKTMYL